MNSFSTTNSYIALNHLRMRAFHGVYEEERRQGNDFIVDVRLKVDLTRAVASDTVSDTVDYAAVCQLVKAEMEIPSALLEHVAGRIARRIASSFPTVEEIFLRISKCRPPMSADVESASVELIITT
ncbi:MAG: dihydroneopterin aldolase [Prevotellaceae bacterium]|jgi:dihydroneopterin aldolase|nr:dihydroneopterin aldolase [Prevotellaceae bacterium]